MQDAWRAYLELALGLSEASRKRAQTVARKLVGSSGATAAQLQTMAEELISTGMANREALTKIVRVEVDRALGVLGLATNDEVNALTRRVQQLERELSAARAAGGADTTPATGPDAASAGKALVPRPVAKKAVAKKAVATRAEAQEPVARQALAKQAVAKKAAANKAAKNAAAKKTTAKKTVAKKATRSSASAGDAA
ncbi:phasin family protein [Plantactinospora sonchi]|uniref:Phasin family protein n=1 Tax=Plantactinospora sonchi TaxID=1544735 RepID=A0ABU7S4Z0_9ACTN